MYIAASVALLIAAAALDFLGKLLFPRIILPLPRGLVADKSSMLGLQGLSQNLNSYALTPQANLATAGTNTTLTAAQFCFGALILTAGASGAFTITLPSTASIIAFMGGTIPTDGTYGEELFLQNLAVGQTGTLTAGDASTTLSGTMTIATNTTRFFLVALTSPSTITITNYGSLAL